MSILAIAAFILLSATAGLHVAWGFGAIWPARSAEALTATVVGRTGKIRMPSRGECLMAASAIFAAGLVALMLAGLIRAPLPAGAVTLIGAAAAAVFLGRGIAGYTTGWRITFSGEPFATLDRRYFSPLCLGLSAIYFVLLIHHMRG